jgi:hypothetical protein
LGLQNSPKKWRNTNIFSYVVDPKYGLLLLSLQKKGFTQNLVAVVVVVVIACCLLRLVR